MMTEIEARCSNEIIFGFFFKQQPMEEELRVIYTEPEPVLIFLKSPQSKRTI